MFHYIQDIPADTANKAGYTLSFAPDKLEEFLQFFQKNNITPVTFWEVKKSIETGIPLPEKSVVLSFDDGHADHYMQAFRLLKKYDMKGVFFIISEKPDNDESYATWSQIQEMAEDGQEIGSHTVTHRSLKTLSLTEIEYELEMGQKKIEEKIQKPVISLCYPAGRYDSRVVEIAKEHYLFARTTHAGKKFSLSSRYEIPTVRIFPTTGLASLRIWFADQ